MSDATLDFALACHALIGNEVRLQMESESEPGMAIYVGGKVRAVDVRQDEVGRSTIRLETGQSFYLGAVYKIEVTNPAFVRRDTATPHLVDG
jgi:hypothetical protein